MILAMRSLSSVSHLAEQFHALSDETRVRIVELLSEGEQCVCELTGQLGLAQSLLSFHLKVLKDAGIVRDRRKGRWAYYSLEADATIVMNEFFETLNDRSIRRTRTPRNCN